MRITSERILQELGEFGVTVGNMGVRVRFCSRWISQCRYDVAKSEKATVDRNTFLDMFTCHRSLFELEVLSATGNVFMKNMIPILNPPNQQSGI